MDLKTFVSQTLIQIVEGVQDAKAHVEQLGIGAAVNPEVVHGERQHAQATDVEFDVAVTVASSEREASGHKLEGRGGGVLAVVSLTARAETGGETGQERRDEAVSRIKFAVKLGQPGAVKKAQSTPIPNLHRNVV